MVSAGQQHILELIKEFNIHFDDYDQSHWPVNLKKTFEISHFSVKQITKATTRASLLSPKNDHRELRRSIVRQESRKLQLDASGHGKMRLDGG
jgi:hypothetical protein